MGLAAGRFYVPTDNNGPSEELHAASPQRYPQSDPTERGGQQPGAGEGEL